jgi:hypothetical protein
VVAVGDKDSFVGCTTAPKSVRLGVPAHRGVIVVRLAADGYQAQAARIAVEGGGAPVAVTLRVLRKATSGTLLVRATPADAIIAIDGVDRGNAPLEVLLPTGSHVVDVRASRHDPAHVPVVVEAEKTKDVPIDLRPSAPITSKWWFWTGIGVVVVGAGVAVWYLIAQPESSPSNGTIEPGHVSAPLVRF